jgi:hypothetical protein
MKAIPVMFLREGLVFSEPVYIEGDNLLVPAGIAVRKKDIERLMAWNIEEVYSDGEPAATPDPKKAPPEPKTRGSSPPASPKNADVYRGYLDIIRRLDSVFSDIGGGPVADPRPVNSIAGDLLREILEKRDVVIGYILGEEVPGRGAAKNSVNTAILSALMAMDLKFTQYRILQIITGALLHDAGMLRLPPEITAKRGGLSEEELGQMYTHPLEGYRIVCRELRFSEEVGAIALQHHEHWDGQGYPQGRAGANIDTGARMVSVADAFEAMVSRKPYRNPMAGYQAMKNLLSDNSQRFDPEILKVFVKVMGVYPIGSVVLLNNGRTGRVVDFQENSPLRPKIRLLADESGRAYPPEQEKTVDLLTEKSLFITKALDSRELARKNG